MAGTTERVAGHDLMREGAPYKATGKRPRPGAASPELKAAVEARGTGTAGTGVGLCSCGETSRIEITGAARKTWHRKHKADVLAAERG